MIQDTQLSRDSMPHIPVSLELWSPLFEKLAAHEIAGAAIQAAIAAQITTLMETLGIPGRPSIQIAAIEPDAQRATYWMHLRVHGKLCRYPPALLQHVYSYISDTLLHMETSPGTISQWLLDCSLDIVEQRDLVSAFFSCTCVEVIKKQPQILLALPQAAAYSASLPLPVGMAHPEATMWPPDPTWLQPILCHVLQQKISLKRRETVAAILYAHQHEKVEDVGEELIVMLRSNIIEIHLSPEYLRQLTIALHPDDSPSFSWLRSEFVGIGLSYPDFHFVSAPDFRADSFAFKVHDLLLLPWKGLNPDQRVADMTTSDARETYHIEGTATISPHRWEENTLFSAHDNPSLAAQSWSPLVYLQLCLFADMKEHAFCFVHHKQVQDQLDTLERNTPRFFQMVTSQYTAGQIAYLLRKLVMQGLSIRNLPRILDHLLDYDFLKQRPSHLSIIDSALAYSESLLDLLRTKDPEFIISFIRAQMKRTIGHTYSGGTNILHTFYLDPAIEGLIFGRRQQSEGQQNDVLLNENESNHLLDALHKQMALLSGIDYTPVILTQMYTRPTLQELVSAEVPRAAVLAIQELPQTISQIQPITTTLLSFLKAAEAEPA